MIWTALRGLLSYGLRTDKKENHNEIQNEAVAKSYMRKGFLIYEGLRKHEEDIAMRENANYLQVQNWPIYIDRIFNPLYPWKLTRTKRNERVRS
jgi:hypothetical protein